MNDHTVFSQQTDTGIRDNFRSGSVGEYLQRVLQPGADLSVVSAYFTIYAYDALRKQLDTIQRMRLLFGEPSFIQSLDPDRTEKKAFRITDDGLRLHNGLEQKRVARDCAKWIEEKAEIRSILRSNLLHGKMYHTTLNGREDAILGSSNFTMSGLGLGSVNNIELNLIVDSARDRADLQTWFAALWNDPQLVKDVKQEVLNYLAQLYVNHPPEFIYFKTLFHLFEQFLAEQEHGGLIDEKRLTDTGIWRALFAFQQDGVRGAINRILKHNGCIVADSVGLGKTYEALAVVKYFEMRNERVLVLCPKKLRENWTVYQAHNHSELNPFPEDRFAYAVLSHTDLSRDGGKVGDIDLETFRWDGFDLVVIDESHNFRNNVRGRRYEDGNVIRKSRYERLMDDILKRGARTKVLLLSATPVNNDLKDLRNQIYLMTEGEDGCYSETIGVRSVKETLTAAQRTFTDWARDRKSKGHSTSVLLEGLNAAFFALLDELTIARSRKHIQKYYVQEMDRIGAFPVRKKPISLYPEIDLKGRFKSYDTLNGQISNYKLSLFNPSRYVLPDYVERYEGRAVRNFKQSDRERFLIGMMKVNFLKRLESSVTSFAVTMQRTVEKIERLEEKIRAYQQRRDTNLAFDWDDADIEEMEDEELRDALQVGGQLKFSLAHLDVDRWLRDLQQDKRELHDLYLNAKDVDPVRDAKLQELKRLIGEKVRQPAQTKDGKPNRKVLIFTAFADTAQYLYDVLATWARDELGIRTALVTGGQDGNRTTFGQNEFNYILTNFSPVSKQRALRSSMPQEGEIDLLIATDCISEGQNLQDCDWVINYDVHWNPVRLIQRFGRIDRIGSVNPTIQMVNFWPTRDLDKYIDLKSRVEARMALVDITATNEEDLLNQEEIRDLVQDDLKYRDKQLLRLREEVLDMEDVNETVTLNEFTLDDFRMELARYIEANRKKLEEAPFGLYAVVPPHPDYPVIQPGTIFCLRQKGETQGSEAVNPLQPYFLAYVRDDGEVRYNFTHPKQILEIFRATCTGRSVPYDTLCDLFDQRTSNGADMGHYSGLLDRAVEVIQRAFRKRTVSQILNRRSGVLVEESRQVTQTTDFELISWLVIVEGR